MGIRWGFNNEGKIKFEDMMAQNKKEREERKKKRDKEVKLLTILGVGIIAATLLIKLAILSGATYVIYVLLQYYGVI